MRSFPCQSRSRQRLGTIFTMRLVSSLIVIWSLCLSLNVQSQPYPCDLNDKCQGEKVCRMVYKQCPSTYCPPKQLCVLPPPSGSSSCPSGLPILASDNKTEIVCGASGVKCPDETYCKADPVDGFAACCWTVRKPGSCPIPLTRGSCAVTCSNDNKCNGDQKCCSTGCGFNCMNPAQEGKPGFCPVSNRPPRCGTLCKNDYMCPNTQKCCLTSCGTQCKKPITFAERTKQWQTRTVSRQATSSSVNKRIGARGRNQSPAFPARGTGTIGQKHSSPRVTGLRAGSVHQPKTSRSQFPKPKQQMPNTAPIKKQPANQWLSLTKAYLESIMAQPNRFSNLTSQFKRRLVAQQSIQQSPPQSISAVTERITPIPTGAISNPLPQQPSVTNVNSPSFQTRQSFRNSPVQPRVNNFAGGAEQPVYPSQSNPQPSHSFVPSMRPSVSRIEPAPPPMFSKKASAMQTLGPEGFMRNTAAATQSIGMTSGTCPRMSALGECQNTCALDVDCPAKQKCCIIGPCKVCLFPTKAKRLCPWQIKMFEMCHLLA